MHYRPLGKTGLRLSALGFGGSSLGSVFRPINEPDAIRAVHTALDWGVNYIDTSPFYGMTKAESVLGRALRGIARERYILSTKVGRYGPTQADFDFSAGRVKRSIDESLGRLGLSHVDILIAHDVEFGDLDQVVNETIPAMRELQRAGKTRFVGISGLPLKVFRYVADRVPLDVVLSYCHYSLNDDTLGGLLPYFAGKQVGVISASPLGMGLLSSNPLPDWHPAPAALKAACGRAVAYCRERGASIEDLAVQFALANPGISSTLVGTADPTEMARNLAAAEHGPDPTLLSAVRAILAPVAGMSWPSGRAENN